MTDTPFSKGFRMPAEWDAHECTWSCWPYDDDMWAGNLAAVRKEFSQFLGCVLKHEDVRLIANDEESKKSALEFMGTGHKFKLQVFVAPIDDVWFRDSGPLYVTKKVGEQVQVLPTKWEFNSWGRKFFWEKDNAVAKQLLLAQGITPYSLPVVMEGGSLEQDGQGIALTTEQCLLSPERNPKLGKADLEKLVKETLGIEKLCWLAGGLEGDHTDGHIDTFARFTSPTTLLCHSCKDPKDPNFHTMRHNKHALEVFSKLHRLGWKVAELPLPQSKAHRDGERLPLTYANYYVFNGGVVVPQYGDKNDVAAAKIIGLQFPGRKVYAVPARQLIVGGGSFHCVTQQQPKGKLVSWENVK